MSTKSVRQGIILVAYDHPAATLPDTAEATLRCPSGTRIVACSPHAFFFKNLFAYKIEHPELPETEFPGPLPFVKPLWQDGKWVCWLTVTEFQGDIVLHGPVGEGG